MKKRVPRPQPCPTCGEQPVVAKTKHGRWRVDCVNPQCQHLDASGRTEATAIEKWNTEVYKV